MLSRFHTKGYQLFSGDATMCRNSIFFYFFVYEKNEKKQNSKVGSLAKLLKYLVLSKTAWSAQTFGNSYI